MMKYIKFFGCLVLAIIVLKSCDNSRKQESGPGNTFHYKIYMDIANAQGPVILIDRLSLEPIKTIYPNTSDYVIEGELPINRLHGSFVLHFPSKYPNPYNYPISDACSIDFDLDRENNIKAHYDSLLFAKVDNEFMNSVEKFTVKNFPSIAEFNVFNREDLINISKEKSREEQLEYIKKGKELIDNVKKELLAKTGLFRDKEQMVNVLAPWSGEFEVEKLDSLSKLFTPEVKNTPSYNQLLAIIDYMKQTVEPKKLKVGDNAPNFYLKDVKGKDYQLTDYRGKYVILDFWASWCGPCKREMPFMRELYEKYHSKGLEILAISTDNNRDAWIKAIDPSNMVYPQLHDKDGEVARSYYVRGIPYVLLINPEGVIDGIMRGEELESLIMQKLK